jgi:hypothetical protein
MAAQVVLAATLVEPGRYEIREYPLPDRLRVAFW